MTTPAPEGDDWRADIDDIDAALIDGYQSDFPVVERPFRQVGTAKE